MTQKELLYIEDAFNHEKNIIEICNMMSNSINDSKIVNFIEKETKKHEVMKDKLYNLLEDKSND